ncbi:hypothetical protein KBC75_04735 [Candidatus Shapirobacteria bacterium]|nr:hypothetical protein [Candidatus Shapirobacteria bacterium]
MVAIDLGQFRDAGYAITWNLRRSRILVPVNTTPQKQRELVLRARIDAFLFGPNHVPEKMLYRQLGIEKEMTFLTGETPATENIITLPDVGVTRRMEMD